MKSCVVDTNVAIAANGRDTHADANCRRSCIGELRELCQGGVIAIDGSGLIFDEYKRYLRFEGAPGMGDVFFKHVYNHQWNPARVRRVPITPIDDDSRGFEELPENGLDKSDRKFLAVARTAQVAILNATDSDWSEQETLTSQLKVTVRQLCPQHAKKG